MPCRSVAPHTDHARRAAVSSVPPAARPPPPRSRTHCRTRRGNSSCAAHLSAALQVPALRLLCLDRLEQRAEVALAESARSLALNDLEEDRRTIFHRLREELQQIAFLILVDEDLQLANLVDRLFDLADAAMQLFVVGVGNRQELDAVRLQLRHGLDDVAAEQRDMLHPRAAVPLEVLVDLALLASRRGLVDGELHHLVVI